MAKRAHELDESPEDDTPLLACSTPPPRPQTLPASSPRLPAPFRPHPRPLHLRLPRCSLQYPRRTVNDLQLTIQEGYEQRTARTAHKSTHKRRQGIKPILPASPALCKMFLMRGYSSRESGSRRTKVRDGKGAERKMEWAGAWCELARVREHQGQRTRESSCSARIVSPVPTYDAHARSVSISLVSSAKNCRCTHLVQHLFRSPRRATFQSTETSKKTSSSTIRLCAGHQTRCRRRCCSFW